MGLKNVGTMKGCEWELLGGVAVWSARFEKQD
jgi:hypothetical protein